MSATPSAPGIQGTTVAVDYDPFAQGAIERVVPTTEPQREIWLADQLGRDASLAFNESVSLRLDGALNEPALRTALQALLDRHSALRANLGPEGDTLCVLDHAVLDVPLLDYSGLDADACAAALLARQRCAVETPFDLQHDRLFRAELLRLSAQEHVLVLTAHHIVCDGWSWWVIVRELAALYASASGVAGEPLPAADDFAGYALQQADAAVDPADEAYWLQRFGGETPTLDLPTDRPRPARRGFESVREDFVLDAALVAALRKLGASRGASLFATLLGTFAMLLARLSGQSRVVVGIPAAGQSVDGHDRLVGHCVNTLPLLFEPDPSKPAAQLIDEAQATLLDAIEHQRYTFGTLLRKIRIERDPSRLPLISAMFNIDQTMDQEHAAFPGMQMDFASNPRAFENFELFVNAVQEHGGLRLECQFNTGLFDAGSIRRWMGYWRTMLQALVVDGGETIALGRLPLLAEIERRQVLEKWNDTRTAVASGACVHELFEAQVARTPDAPAVEFQGRRLAYRELNAEANRLARHLREAGVRADDRVAICAERGLEMVVALFAVLKAGGAYVPLDPAYPAERLAFQLEDSAPRLLLLQPGLAGGEQAATTASVRVLPLSPHDASWRDADADNLDRDGAGLSASSLAYVIYTSGSTGKPKGVLLEHAGVCNYLEWAVRTYAPSKGGVVSSSFAFDATVTSLFAPLLCGGMVRIVPEKQEIDGLLQILTDPAGCGLVKITPAHLDALGRRLQANGGRSHVDAFVVGGEALPAATVRLWRELQPGVRIVNEYGPTETVVGCCIHDIPASAAVADPVPIGRPISNMRIYILDAFGQPTPVGVAGEIHIGGAGVARGYLDRPELTAERFLPDPFANRQGARMYRSGDLGRWLPDGNIEYLGRNDFQVKIRGYRVELGEIERTLATHGSVEQAVALVRTDRPGNARLVAYVVPKPGAQVDAAALQAHLRPILPDYMVPQHFVALQAIPLTGNGKVDRKALPAPDLDAQRSGERVAPRNALERTLAEAMGQVLGVPDIGIHDDFFALGGHSLLAAQLTTRLNRDLGVQLSLRSVFDAPTVARLAALVSAAEPATARKPIVRRADQRSAPLSLMQDRCRLIEEYNPGNLSYNGPSGHRLTGPLDPELLDRAFRQLAQRQTVLRTSIGRDADGQPVQIVHDDIDPGLREVQDLSMLPQPARDAELGKRMRALVETPFSDLSRAPLFVARLFRMAPDEHVLFFMPHHIVWDGWSFDLLYADLGEIYAALAEERAPALQELPVSYGDFAAWHLDWLKGEEYVAQVAFWRERLGRPGSDGQPLAAMPTDKPRRRGMSGKSGSQQIVIDDALTAALQSASRGMDVTLFVALLSAYVLVLGRMAGREDIVVGTPVRGRNTAEVEGLMGYFTNLLPLRLAIDPSRRFVEFVRDVRAAVLDSFAHPDVRLEDLSRELSLRSEGGGSMLYHALFSFQDVRQRVARWGPLRHERVEVFQPGATEDLGLWFVEESKGLTGGLIYNADILAEATTTLLRDRYVRLLQAIARDPEANIADLTRFDDGAPLRIGEAQAATTEETEPMQDTTMDTTTDGRVAYLTALWTEMLGTAVAPDDNFFDIGGNSMLAVQMAERVAGDTGVRLKLMRIAVQTLADIAADLPDGAAKGGSKPAARGGVLGGLKRLFGG
ncbi:MAG: amino acid adenylation domain-containing protein [Pseudoxanthomonas sp.]